MIEKDFFKQIQENYFSENYSIVVELWESNTKEKKIDALIIEDKFKLNEALSVSYFEIGNYSQSLCFVNKQIQLLNEDTNSKGYGKNIDFYYLLKAEIYRKKKDINKEYKLIMEYIKIRGENNELAKSKIILEKSLIKKTNRINAVVTYFYILIIIMYYILYYGFKIKLLSSQLFLIFLIIGLLWIGFYLFYPSVNKKFLMWIISLR